MKRSVKIAIIAVIGVAIASPVLAYPFYDRIVPMLGPLLPRYEGIPKSASAKYSFKEGMFWTWKRPTKSGCLSWMAMENWASVRVIVDGPCDPVHEIDAYRPKGLTYSSFENHLLFQGYWPWSPDVFYKLIIYDNRGMIQNVLPCPYSLTANELREMRLITAEALSNRLTESEKRVIAHISERLTRVDGNALSSSQHGCSDWHDDEEDRQRVDPWTVAKR